MSEAERLDIPGLPADRETAAWLWRGQVNRCWVQSVQTTKQRLDVMLSLCCSRMYTRLAESTEKRALQRSSRKSGNDMAWRGAQEKLSSTTRRPLGYSAWTEAWLVAGLLQSEQVLRGDEGTVAEWPTGLVKRCGPDRLWLQGRVSETFSQWSASASINQQAPDSITGRLPASPEPSRPQASSRISSHPPKPPPFSPFRPSPHLRRFVTVPTLFHLFPTPYRLPRTYTLYAFVPSSTAHPAAGPLSNPTTPTRPSLPVQDSGLRITTTAWRSSSISSYFLSSFARLAAPPPNKPQHGPPLMSIPRQLDLVNLVNQRWRGRSRRISCLPGETRVDAVARLLGEIVTLRS
ncbi:hypothetical protein K402DRAFT_405380 [Aulographum hederae CBS 113979]|uniref:Uncharacterized protein n=1 Tax=Aulographum hederae CBS 113979 TaxID=1176131 RepID=A0A6G1GWV8_9PEZI|nr:hypothetical protein K402DRAFT_405380 [Aulographum hederae CBS 113979]